MHYPGAPAPGCGGAWCGYPPDPWAGAYGAPPPQAAAGWPPPQGYPGAPPPHGPPAPGFGTYPPPGANGFPQAQGAPPAKEERGGHRERGRDRARDRDRDRDRDRGRDRGGGGGGEGTESFVLHVAGCKHDVVGDIVNGTFSMMPDKNHGRPVYKKNTRTAAGLEVHVYYWDDRDGANFCGWYFGQKVGGDEVWAYHPEKPTNAPPSKGWQVPYDGPVDHGLTVVAKTERNHGSGKSTPASTSGGGSSMGTYPPAGAPAAGPAAYPPPGHPPIGVPPPLMGPPPAGMHPWDLHNYHMMQHQQHHMAMVHAQEQQRQQEMQKKKSEQADKRRRQEDEKRRREEEAKRKQNEEKAVKNIMQVVQKLRVATPEGFDALKKELEDTLAKELPLAGSSSSRMKEEADKGLSAAQKCIEMINARRKLVEDKRREMEAKQKALEDRAKSLMEELLGLVASAEEQSRRLADVARPLGGLPLRAPVQAPMPGMATIVAPASAGGAPQMLAVPPALAAAATVVLPPNMVGSMAATAPAAVEPGTPTAAGAVNDAGAADGAASPPAGGEVSGEAAANGASPTAGVKVEEDEAMPEVEKKEAETPPIDPTSLSDEEILSAAAAIEEAGAQAEAMTKSCTTFVLQKGPEMKSLVPAAKLVEASEMNQALARLLKQIQELAIASEAMLAKAKQAKARVQRRTAAKEHIRNLQDMFRRFDRDQDGYLSRSEVQTLSKTEYGFRLPNKTMERIWQNLVEEGAKGVTAKDMQRLKIHIGIAREVSRDDQRKLVTAAKLKVLENVRQGLSDRLRELLQVADEASKEVSKLELKMKPLATKARGMVPGQMVLLSDESDHSIRETAMSVDGLRSRMASLSEGVEKRFQEDVRVFIKEQAKPLYFYLGRLENRLQRTRNLSSRFRQVAAKRKARELDRLRTSAARLIRHNKRVRKCSEEELFGTQVSEEEFCKFFESANCEIRLADERAALAAEAAEAATAAMDAARGAVPGARKEAPDAASIAAAVAAVVAAPPVVVPPPSPSPVAAVEDAAVGEAAAAAGDAAAVDPGASAGSPPPNGETAADAPLSSPAPASPAAASPATAASPTAAAAPVALPPAAVAAPAVPVVAPGPMVLATTVTGPVVVAPPGAATNGQAPVVLGDWANGIDGEMTEKVRRWLEFELAALTPAEQVAPLRPESERQVGSETEVVRLSPEEVSRLFAALAGSGDEAPPCAAPDGGREGAPAVGGTLPRATLFARLLRL